MRKSYISRVFIHKQSILQSQPGMITAGNYRRGRTRHGETHTNRLTTKTDEQPPPQQRPSISSIHTVPQPS